MPVSLVTGFMIFRSIDPYYMGIWATFAVFETYAGFMRMGVINGMNRELPYALGAGKKEEAEKYIQTTLAFTLGNITILLLIAPFIASGFEMNATYLACIAVYVIKISLSFYTSFLAGTFRSDDNFNRLSNIQFIMLVLRLALIPLVLLGFNGYLLMETILFIINAILYHYHRPFRLKPSFNFTSFKNLMKIGFPIFVTSYLISVIDTLPRLYIINFGNETLLGLYAPIIFLLSTSSILQNSLANYIYPKFSYHWGKTHDTEKIWKTLLKIYLVSIVFLLTIVLVIYLLVDFVITFFPKYSASLPYIKLGLLIVPFIIYKLGNLLNVIFKNYSLMAVYVIIYAFLQAASLYVISLYVYDILKIVIYSQVITSLLLLLISMVLNYYLINKMTVKINPLQNG
jgi:O-antigen/teichoic acid export membrane protein